MHEFKEEMFKERLPIASEYVQFLNHNLFLGILQDNLIGFQGRQIPECFLHKSVEYNGVKGG